MRITRAGWEEALGAAVLSAYTPGVYRDYDDWHAQSEAATVVVQWDPERDLRGKSLPQRSIQVGLSRHIIAHYVEEWTMAIRDVTPLVRKLHGLIQSGSADKAAKHLPREERVYPTPPDIARRLGMG